ncbi:MAG: hypothetical protein LUQ26_06045, partial [Methylococcaceae bacterium]|nr:hypothetical protein [Methylococcaceae bacterium]
SLANLQWERMQLIVTCCVVNQPLQFFTLDLTLSHSSLYTSAQVIRHTRREAGIQCHGWRA